MAGEQLIKMLTERGDSDSEHSDVIYGHAINVSPLRVQISNPMTIDDNFTVLGKRIGNFSMNGSLTIIEEKKGKSGEKPKTEKTTGSVTFIFDNSLRVGDRVIMIRANDGQQFCLFEREGG